MTKQVYHGTERLFTEFDFALAGSKMSGRPHSYVFFSSSREAALYFGPNVIVAEVDFWNPFIVSSEDAGKRSPVEWADEVVLSNHFKDTDFDGVIIRDYCDGDTYSDVYIAMNEESIRIKEIELDLSELEELA